MSNSSDGLVTALVDRLKANDEPAWRALVGGYEGPLF
jgi:hypothetical protein